MDELKELLETISKQLEGIDLKLAVIANNSQQQMPQIPGQTRYYFGMTASGPTISSGVHPKS